MTHRTRFLMALGLQLLLLLSLAGAKQYTVLAGTRILLRSQPVDPRDLFRGDYVALRYDISRLPRRQWREPSFHQGQTVYVTLSQGPRFWTGAFVDDRPPEDGSLFLRGRVRAIEPGALEVTYGLENYFVPEGEGWKLEALQRKRGRVLAVEVSVDRRGHGVIRGVRAMTEP